MKEADFVFDRIEGGKYCDYWFRVLGDTKAELTDRYMEQSMVEVTEVVFSIQDGQFGVKRLFPFNYDVVANPDDKDLRAMLQYIAFKTYREMKLRADAAMDEAPI